MMFAPRRFPTLFRTLAATLLAAGVSAGATADEPRPVALVEFASFDCQFCQAMSDHHPAIEAAVEDAELEYRYAPSPPIPASSVPGVSAPITPPVRSRGSLRRSVRRSWQPGKLASLSKTSMRCWRISSFMFPKSAGTNFLKTAFRTAAPSRPLSGPSGLLNGPSCGSTQPLLSSLALVLSC